MVVSIVENLSSGEGDTGRVPRTIDCELTSDLTGSCVPGDSVTICGLVKVSTQDQGKSHCNKYIIIFIYVALPSHGNFAIFDSFYLLLIYLLFLFMLLFIYYYLLPLCR